MVGPVGPGCAFSYDGGLSGWHGPACMGFYPDGPGACFGCNGCAGSFYGPAHGCAIQTTPLTEKLPEAIKPKDKIERKIKLPDPVVKAEPKAKTTQVKRTLKARVIVRLPREAEFFMDGQKMKSKGARRVFRTPALDAGKSYYYELTAKMKHKGKTVKKTRRLVIRPGDEYRVTFTEVDFVGPNLVSK